MASHNQNFDDTLIGRESRESDYRTWSERAVIVGFNAETESYDIVITTEKTLGDNIRSLNRTIRNVKAVIDPNTDIFLPGESVIVGYVDDRREHPVIVGLGDSSGHTCIKVTLGVTSTTPTIEGPTAPSIEEPEFNVFFPMSLSCLDPNVLGSEGSSTIPTGSTNGECNIDCSASEPEIRLTAINGKPPYTWTLPLMGPAGCSYGGVDGPSFGEPVPDDANNRRLVITTPENNPILLTQPAYNLLGHRDFDCLPAGGSTGVEWPIRCDEKELVIAFVTSVGNCYGAEAGSDPCSAFVCFTGDPDFFTIACPTALPQGPCIGGNILPHLDAIGLATAKTFMFIQDVRTPAMLSGGCCPCTLAFGGLMVTVADADNVMITVTMVVNDQTESC